jgi:hypothetical protein
MPVVFSEPRIGRGFIDEDLEVAEITDPLTDIDVNPDGCRSHPFGR